MRFLFLVLCCLAPLTACSPPSHVNVLTPQPRAEARSLFPSCAAMKSRLLDITAMTDPIDREAVLDALWDSLRVHNRFPFVAGDSVAFLFRGDAATVNFTGDFNGWDPAPPKAARLGNSSVWLQEEVFPRDARLDYKIVLNGDTWLLDPENPRLQRSGFGDNSELRMPAYVPSPYVIRASGIPRGTLTPGHLDSTNLRYTVHYVTYTPARYPGLDNLPVIYVTDGHEYADDAMGSMVIVLDNLIDRGLIRPIMAVFIDPRVDGRNLRSEQYILNEHFVRFVADELVPVIDTEYRTSHDRLDRGILGTSLGGLNSAWFALRASDTFGRIGIQSPAFQAGPDILDMFAKSPRLDVDIFMTWGTMHDFSESTLKFQNILEAKGYRYHHLVVNEGHSWGAWRALLDDILREFWPEPQTPRSRAGQP